MVAALEVSEIKDAGQGEFRSVTAEVDGKIYGCDVYASEVIDWQDGNGLIANDIASKKEIKQAILESLNVVEYDFVNGTHCGAGYDVFGYLAKDGRMAAHIKHLSSGTSIFETHDDEESFKTHLRHVANGANISPESESDEGAEDMWNALHDEFKNQ